MKKNSDYLAIIPARIGSKRLPGKPLTVICGKTMIQHVYERVLNVMSNVYVATDSTHVYGKVTGFGGKVIIIPGKFNSGTDRCYSAYRQILAETGIDYKGIINVQGDQPLIKNEHIQMVIDLLKINQIQICTVATKTRNLHDLNNRDSVFVVLNKYNNALYFSHCPIPYARFDAGLNWDAILEYFKHIGVYGYTPQTLNSFYNLKQSYLERTEKLEQLRWLENGHLIKVALSLERSPSVDTVEDLKIVTDLIEMES